MNNDEITLWNYLDGNCTTAEKVEVERRLATDSAFYSLHKDLLNLNDMATAAISLEEPSMAFNSNVMRQIRLEIAPVPLKTKINKQIIGAITALFISMLGGLTLYAFSIADKGSSINWGTVEINGLETLLHSKATLYAFLMFDAILLLIYLDRYLRKGLKFNR